MMEFHGRGILLDIEGTVCAVSFVYDVLFPFARRELPGFLAQAWEDPAQADLFDLLAQDAGCANRAAWLGGLPAKEAQQRVATVVYAWMDQDRKLRGLKELQGRVWRSGYESGTLRSRLFPDVAPALRAWVTRGFDVRIYSSGSAAAQQLFFRYTEDGDLTPLLRGFYDTAMGAKQEPASYGRITQVIGLRPAEILFVSDVPSELEAARTSGLRTALAVRPGNRPVTATFPVLREFSELRATCTRASALH